VKQAEAGHNTDIEAASATTLYALTHTAAWTDKEFFYTAIGTLAALDAFFKS
jgi:hypothetical protein